jgi:hypothetical protein
VSRPPARCGTPSGWRRHLNEGSKACDACVRAKAEYDARSRSTDEQKLKTRIRAKAQFRAYQALARTYPDEYKHNYERELVLVRQEAEQLARGADEA